ncbi:MAG: glycosyltransferase family 2 protein [Chloroherpetonaceae bacterium]|nr:glycosyltransferase family 2 protein [Chthonomonadaceae bacterium]MDW8208919.1 glycosyltransferase family 2 protein [Chloroherpetonaceae bacterium]
MEISVVVPVYRSGEGLRELHRRLTATLQSLTPEYEIIFVEDCGGDNSWEVITCLAANDPHVRGIRFSRNFGQHAATICGISRATGNWVVTIDDDLEQSPEDIPTLLDRAKQGYDLVYGVFPERAHSRWRNFTSHLARRLFTLAIPSLNREYTSFRVLRQTVAQALPCFDSPYPFIDGYLSWVTHRYATVPVRHGSRARGGSNYTVRKLLAHTINIFVTFSDLPLRFAIWLGLGTFLGGLAWLAWIVVARLLGGITVSGYASIMAAIILFGGLQMLILGIMGEYLARVNFKTSRKPLYLVAQETEQHSAPETLLV